MTIKSTRTSSSPKNPTTDLFVVPTDVDAPSHKMAIITPDTPKTNFPAAIDTTERKSLNSKLLTDVTNNHPSRFRFLPENENGTTKDPFARYRLRQQQQQQQQQLRRKRRQFRRTQHQGEEVKGTTHVSGKNNNNGRAGDDRSRRNDATGEERSKKRVDNNSSMPPPNEGMTNLLLLQRQNRINDLRQQTRERVGEQRVENSNQTANPSCNTGTPTVATSEVHRKVQTLETQITALDRTISSYNSDGFDSTVLSDGTPVYSSLPFHSMRIADCKEDTTSTADNLLREEVEKEKGKLADSVLHSQGVFYTNNDKQRGIHTVDKSSDIPIAQSSCMSSDIDMKDSIAIANDTFDDDQYYGNNCCDKGVHQNVNTATAIEDNTVEDDCEFASCLIPSDGKTRKKESRRLKTDVNIATEQQQEEENMDEPVQIAMNSNKTQFKDIIGHQSVKLRLDEVLLPLALPASISRTILTGVRSLPASIFMYGPPGCGKTKLAKAIAGEAHAAFLSIGPSDILSKYVGESEEAIRAVFAEAVILAQNNREGNRCTVLFFDEIDALGQSRGDRSHVPPGGPHQSGGNGSGDNSSRRILAELLIQLTKVNTANGTFDSAVQTEDLNNAESGNEERRLESREEEEEGKSGDSISSISSDETVIYKGDKILDKKEGLKHDNIDINLVDYDNRSVRVIVVAATNRREDCDPALIRRFAVQIPVGLPNAKDRRKMLKRSMQDIEHAITQKQFSDISLITDGWSGSDVQNLAREAAMAPVRECIRSAALLKRRRNCSNSYRRKNKKIKQNSSGQKRSHRSENESLNERSHTQASKEKGGGHYDDGDNNDSITGPKERLLEEFRNLRPVNFRDYTKALTFSFSQMYSNLNDSPLLAFGWIDECGGNRGTNGDGGLKEHYDSSSDEDEEEDDDYISVEDNQTQQEKNPRNKIMSLPLDKVN